MISPSIIHLLPERVANQIAAGEVVQRPASALKELIENSLDAGSDEIQIIIKDGGKSLIQVNDNGRGMTRQDALLSFSRHATSKIIDSEDLFQIQTLGFRGEALASIAAVAQVRMRTRHHEEEIGVEIRIEGSEIKEEQEISGPIGTSLEIKNLFFNIPARRSFLKSDIIELKHLISEVEKISLSYPKVMFSFINQGKEILHLPKGSLLQRIMHLFGTSYAEKIIPLQEATDLMTISGYVGKPEFSKKTRGEQYFHLNGRFIRDPYLHHAIMTVYQEWIPTGHFPFYSIHLTVDPTSVDVNVHPSKTEIKFLQDRLIYTLLQTAVKRSLGKFHLSPQIDFDAETGFSEMSVLGRNDPICIPQTQINYHYNPFKTENLEEFQKPKFSTAYSLFQKRENLFNENGQGIQASNSPKGIAGGIVGGPMVMQIQREFILTSIHSGLIVIDQQAAHERILYERYLQAFTNPVAVSQKNLFPQSHTFSTQDSILMDSLLPDVKMMGFDIREFGKNTFILEGMPTDLLFSESIPIIEEILLNFKENRDLGKMSQRENLAHILSKKASIKSGRELSHQEMCLLMDELFACEAPMFSPSLKPTYISIPLQEIKTRFKE